MENTFKKCNANSCHFQLSLRVTEPFRYSQFLNIFSRFLYLPPTPTYSEAAGELFCRTIWSAWVAFVLGYISIYTCLALTIERWLAVLRPTTYNSVKSKHAVYALIFVWFWGPAVNATTLFRAKYIREEKRCVWTKLPVANKELPWMDFTMQSLIPFTSMVVLYCHIYYTMKRLPRLSSNRDVQLKRITVVALLACSALIIGWLPGRITFMLTKFGHLDANGEINITCVMITFLNSCVNPFLYGIYSPAFRSEYKEVFRKTFAACHWGSGDNKAFNINGHVENSLSTTPRGISAGERASDLTNSYENSVL
jgi:hypothetical protein